MHPVRLFGAPLAVMFTAVTLAVGGVASEPVGAAPPVRAWLLDGDQSPLLLAVADEETIHRELVTRVQALLSLFGYKPGSTDGVAGPQTRAAIRAFQEDNGLKPDGLITLSLLRRLDAMAGGESPARASLPDAPDLGVSRAAIQALFEGPEFGFVFTDAAPAGGHPRIIGKAPNRLAHLELVGTPQVLREASILLGMPREQPDAVAQNAVYMLSLIKTIVPDWPQATEWVNENVERAMTEGQASIVWNNKKITLLGIADVGALAVSVKSIR